MDRKKEIEDIVQDAIVNLYELNKPVDQRLDVAQAKWFSVDSELSYIKEKMKENVGNKMVIFSIYSSLDPNKLVESEACSIIDDYLKDNANISVGLDKGGKREYKINIVKN